MIRILLLCIPLMLALPLASQASDPTALSALQLRDALQAGTITATTVTRAFLGRIAALDHAGPQLNAVLTVNPEALAIAAALDAHFAEHGPMGPLHGIPVLLKANIETADRMPTSAGSLALADHHASADAFLVARLRAAGAVVLGKTNLSEWANFRDNAASSGWSSHGGQTRNPHVLDRNPCGSSSGSAVAVAARLAPLAVGTETDGSIACPSGVTGIVGIKPTVGTVSRRGIIPISHTQDTAGPMARNVADAALLLAVLVAADPDDAGALAFTEPADLLAGTGTRGLQGLRIGVYRGYYGAGAHPRVDAVFEDALATLRGLGAELLDPLPYAPDAAAFEAEYQVLLTEFKVGLNAYLAGTALPADRRTLADLIDWNDAHAARVMPHFGQSIFLEAQATTGLDDPAYLAALNAGPATIRADLQRLLTDLNLDLIVSATNGPAWKTDWVSGDRFEVGSSSLAAMSGFPSVIVPAGHVARLPIAVSFIGPPLGEALLIRVGHAFEQATGALLEPALRPSIED